MLPVIAASCSRPISFDGFDECPAELCRKSLVAGVIDGSYLSKATVLVTSRLSATAELLSVYQAHVVKHTGVVGFSGCGGVFK